MKLHLLVIIFFMTLICYSQNKTVLSSGSKPQIGNFMPEFSLNNVTFYKDSSVSLKDFKGKWLFMDFWFTGCTTCIKSFPKINDLQRKFKDDIQFLMIGVNAEKYGDPENVYKKLAKKYELELVSAYDSILQVKWDIWSMPYIIVVDPKGFVRGLTSGTDFTDQNLMDLIKGNDVVFDDMTVNRHKYEIPDVDFNSEKSGPLSNDSLLIYRSILTKWSGQAVSGTSLEKYVKRPEDYRREGFKLSGYPLAQLYKLAYWGKDIYSAFFLPEGVLAYPYPVIRVSNDHLFQVDYKNMSGLFNYNLAINSLKNSNLDKVMKVFQNELKTIFEFDVCIEDIKMPVWCIVEKSKNALENLKTKGGKEKVNVTPVSIEMQNVPVQYFFDRIIYELYSPDRVFISGDNLGFSSNIDITLNAILTDFNDTKNALNKLGLDIILLEKEMKCIVIKDPNPMGSQ